MPARGRLARAGAQGVCSALLIVFGAVIVLPGVIIIAFQDDVNNNWGIVGMCVLGFGAVCLIIGFWMCSSCFKLCCKKEERGRVISAVEGDRNGRNRRKRGKKSSAQSSASAAQGPPVGYLPPNPGTRPTSGGYLPMNPQQGYNLGPANTPIPITSVANYPVSSAVPNYPQTSAVPTYPQTPSVSGYPQTSVVSSYPPTSAVPGYPPTSCQPIPNYPPGQFYPAAAVSHPGAAVPPQHGYYPEPAHHAQLPPASVSYHHQAQQYPAAVVSAVSNPSPMAVYPAQAAPSSSAENLPYNPHFISSSSQPTQHIRSLPTSHPSAPPQDDPNARPPTYDEAMSVNKI